jgi:hypothetical protein
MVSRAVNVFFVVTKSTLSSDVPITTGSPEIKLGYVLSRASIDDVYRNSDTCLGQLGQHNYNKLDNVRCQGTRHSF